MRGLATFLDNRARCPAQWRRNEFARAKAPCSRSTISREIIARRAAASAEASYTRTLLDKGVAHCAKKFGEEAIETTIAAVAAGRRGAARRSRRRSLSSAGAAARARRPAGGRARGARAAHAAQRSRGKGVAPRHERRSARSREGLCHGRLDRRRSRRDDAASPYRHFTRDEWAKLRADTELTLTIDDLRKLQSTTTRSRSTR